MSQKNLQQNELDPALFKKPTSEYRAAPFWAWNCKLNKEQLLRQIEQLKAMGMGGFNIHSRVGLDTEYLGNEFMGCVKSCCARAKELGMLCRLYDEDRWPSGSAGGLVTKDKKYRNRFLTMTPRNYVEDQDNSYMAAAKPVYSDNKTYLGSFQINLDHEGCMVSYQKVAKDEKMEGRIWDAYLEVSGDTPWFNDQAYVNTLDRKAIDRFIEVTYEKYYKELGSEFGKEIPTIFTDEPQTCQKSALRSPFEETKVVLPYTDDFEQTFQKKYGVSVLEYLPELFWEKANGEISQIRYWYHAHVCDRFSEAFGDNIGTWCREHGIKLTGHMMNEWTLHSQTLSAGDVMRPLKEFGIPGVDMLCDRRELSTVKQASSVSHQMNRNGVMSELYGVTGWDFDFRGHKLGGDWQAALGVTLRVPHLSWVSMEGEGKRDYPASIGYQSPWYREYSYIEDHFARLNTALTRGKPIVRVGVIHPIESYWLYWGNQRQTAVVRQDLESNFTNVINWLLYDLIDFDFISEAMLSEDSQSCADKFRMGSMEYETVVVPQCHTIRSTTLEKLQEFVSHGGKVIFMGEPPRFVDAAPSDEPLQLAGKCMQIPYQRGSLLNALESQRDVDVELNAEEGEDPTKVKQWETGIRSNNMFYQMRQDGENRWLFLTHVNPPVNKDVTYTEKLDIHVRGKFQPVLYDTLTGKIKPVFAEYADGWTRIPYDCSQYDSILLKLVPQETIAGEKPIYINPQNKKYLPEPKSFTLDEKNVFLLDLAEYSFDGDPFREEEEILRIDNNFRHKLGYPLRMEALAQPWTEKSEEAINHTLHLKFTVNSEVDAPETEFAMEHPENVQITWNGKSVSSRIDGWYVDESIQTVALPGGVQAGKNVLELSIPFGRKTNVEWCYLLGDFGVEVAGKQKQITRLPDSLAFGDIVSQRLPFYAGNFVYEVPFTCESGELNIEVSHYRGSLVQAELDGRKIGNIVLAPYRLNCGSVKEGHHVLRLKVFGNRVNAFGALHNADETEEWYGPNLWRTVGNKWSYEYQFKKMGILTTPQYWMNP